MSAFSKRLARLGLVLFFACATTAGAQQAAPQAAPKAQQAPMPAGAAPQFQRVELSADSAKRSIDTYLTLREKYGNKIPSPKRAQALAKAAKDTADINAVVTGNGFTDAADWQRTLANVALAYGFEKDDQGANMDAKIAEMKGNKDIPANIRDQMVQMMTSMRPSENNLKVISALTADPVYGPKLAEIAK